jgi:hypothetical protein
MRHGVAAVLKGNTPGPPEQVFAPVDGRAGPCARLAGAYPHATRCGAPPTQEDMRIQQHPPYDGAHHARMPRPEVESAVLAAMISPPFPLTTFHDLIYDTQAT